VQLPISCTALVNIDQTDDPNRDAETAPAVNNLTHAATSEGDTVETASPPSPPFQFVAGAGNPLVISGALTVGTDVMVSNSVVTVPVIDTTTWPPANFPQVQVIGFVQLFLSPDGTATPVNGHVRTQVLNVAGCGSGWSAEAILGNGASAVPVRLISPPRLSLP